MTYNEFFTAVINANISADATAYAQKALARMENTYAKTAEKRREKRTMNDAPLMNGILELSDSTPRQAKFYADKLGVTPSKASFLARSLVEAGKLQVTSIKSEAPSGGKVKAYFIGEN